MFNVLLLIMALLTTDRWFDYPQKVKDHIEQQRLKEALYSGLYDDVTIAAGRRSFKTERFLKRFFVERSITGKDKELYLGAPTRIQAKDIFWKDIKALSKSIYVSSISEAELKIEYTTGSVLKIVGLKEFKRVQGGRAHMVGVTEWQDCDPAVYTESFQPMLNDTGGLFIREGRPFGKNHLFDDYMRGVRKAKGCYSAHWPSSDILSVEQTLKAKAQLTQADYEREYEASFETESGTPYYGFDSKRNSSDFQLNYNLPVVIACDFNATNKPMSWVVGQFVNGKTYWVQSLSYQFTNTETMCGILYEDYFKKQMPRTAIFYGDYAGKQQKSNSSYSDWQIIENYFGNLTNFEKRIKPMRSIRDSIAATNAQYHNALNEVKQFVNIEGCKELVEDYDKVKWKSNGKELEEKESEPKRGHCCRAVDYYNDYEFPIKGKKESHWGTI